jgi:uridine kinase
MVIAIGGPSNSGKSTLAELLRQVLSNKKTIILSQDDYVYPEQNIPLVRDHIDWEIPESIHFTKFKQAIRAATKENDIVIAEGFMIYYDPELNSLFDKKIFISLSKEEFFSRKSKDLRWGKEEQWYIKHIWSSFQKYGKLKNKSGVLILNGEKDFDVHQILELLNI